MSATMNLTEGLSTGRHSFYNVSLNGSAVFQRSPTTEKVLNVFTIIILFITMLSLGCTMEMSKIKAHILKPTSVAIALLSQFGIMPLTAFTVAKVLQLESIESVTVLICGCCPGGTLSNIFSLALNGDMNLSIVLTTCSSILALGMMPLLLFLYCQGLNLENALPYTNITLTVLFTLVPCGIGIAINHYKPRYSAVIQKVGLSILIISAVVVAVIVAVYIGKTILGIFSPQVISAAALMPLIGYILGYALSTIFKISHQCRRTISMETGCQNIQLCTTIMRLAFPPEVVGPMFLFPLLYIIFQICEALLLTLLFRCYITFKSPAEGKPVYVVVDQRPQPGPQPVT